MINRRRFCHTAVAASVVAAIPMLPGCERKAPVATEANTSIRGISLDGAEIELEKAAIRELGESMTGPVVLSGHPDYDNARKVWNGMHDRRPALIARCLNSNDVSNAITFSRERDLLVAVRGGGNFGVVTDFEYQLYPFERNVLSGSIIWPIAQARDVLEFYGGWYQGLSDELYVGPTMATMPDGTGIILMEVVYNGDPVVGEKELEPLRKIGTPMDDGIKMQDYMVMQTQEDVAFGHGVRSYIKNGMVKEITQELIDAMIEAYTNDPRLVKIKGQHDPGNLFRLNSNIAPVV